MSRRKQEKPQPRKNLIAGEADVLQFQDILTCGVCQKDFPLSDIVRFIQHKVQLCNKENCLDLYDEEDDDRQQDPSVTLLNAKKEAKDELLVSSSSLLKKAAKDTSANTIGNVLEPRNYICSTCKQSLSSAWALILHAQNIHGLSICADTNDEKVDKSIDSSSTFNHSFNLRAPLLERQMDPASLFTRNSSQDLRLDLIGNRSSTHLTNGSIIPCKTPPPLLEPPQLTNCEPMQDFYSQRLRVLAGATSPKAASTPRKLLQTAFKVNLNNKGPPTPPETSQSPPDKPDNVNLNSSASSTTSDHNQSSSAKNRLCEYCGKSFQFKSNLIVHRRSHTGEKPFKCHICNHACTQASKLKRHMKTHREKNNNANETSKLNSNHISENGISKDSTNDTKLKNGPEKQQVNGNGDYTSDERDEDDEEEINVEEEEVDEEELNVDCIEEDEPRENGEGNLVIDHDDDMVAEDLTKKTSLSNGSKKEDDDNLKDKTSIKQSVVTEFMEKIGFCRIPQYNEAYKQALKESSFRNSIKQENCSSGTEGSASNDAGSHSYDMPFHHLERPPREGTRSAGQSPLNFGIGVLDPLEQSMSLKRMRLDEQWKDKEREGNFTYAGVWYPRVEHAVSTFRDLYREDGHMNHRNKSSTESALISVDNSRSSMSPLPGPSSALCGALANSLVKPKGEQRRNDTCEYCGKVFKNCSNLTVHRRSHTGEKPYKCELCSYACAQSSKLTRHMKTHGRLGKDVYRCRFCDMPFSVPSTLEKHMRKCVVSQSGNSPYVLSERDSDSKEMSVYDS